MSERDEIERLNDAWNRLVDGGSIGNFDLGDAEAMRRLIQVAGTPRPRRTYVRQLKEQLMHVTGALPTNGVTQHEPMVATLPATPVLSARRGRRWWDGSRRGLGAVATVALVIVTLIAGYLAISSPESEDDGSPGATGGQVEGTPLPGSAVALLCDRYFPTCPSVRRMGSGFVYKPDYSDAELAVRNAQLQGWSVDPGARVELAGDSTSGVRGAVVDVVIEGVYVVIVDSAAVISRAQTPIAGSVEYLQPGAVAELGRGDAISYPAGRARTITNPLSTVTLRFKSAVFYDGDVSITRPADPQPAGVQVQVNGDGVLPTSLAEYQGNEVVVILDYIQVFEEYALPDIRSGDQRIIGPVDTDPEQAGLNAGYVLWVGETKG